MRLVTPLLTQAVKMESALLQRPRVMSVCNTPRQHSGKALYASGPPRRGVWVGGSTLSATHVTLRSANRPSPDVI